MAVGSVSAKHGVDGLDNCYQLKTIRDSLDIRKRLLKNLEAASLPVTTEEEREVRVSSYSLMLGRTLELL
jgi:NADH dehydrogenase FAD-containing subunit